MGRAMSSASVAASDWSSKRPFVRMPDSHIDANSAVGARITNTSPLHVRRSKVHVLCGRVHGVARRAGHQLVRV